VDVIDHLDDGDRARITPLLDAVALVDRRPALSDHLTIAFTAGGGEGFHAAIWQDRDTPTPIAYAQTSAANDALAMELVIDPERRVETEHIGASVVEAMLMALHRDDPIAINWWIHGSAALERVAVRTGFERTRTLRQMRRSLPAERHAGVQTRSFVVGRDEPSWVEVNNRAFAGHGEQGGWTVDTLRQRETEPWFDPDGFRIHEVDGRLAAFCWTKVHPPTPYDPDAVGEIYVIAVDPDFHGRGLGAELTLAGLDHLSERGLRSAILYVDGDNTAAVGLYEGLGFHTERLSAAYRLDPHITDGAQR
jgi:mycothiol synthase